MNHDPLKNIYETMKKAMEASQLEMARLMEAAKPLLPSKEWAAVEPMAKAIEARQLEMARLMEAATKYLQLPKE